MFGELKFTWVWFVSMKRFEILMLERVRSPCFMSGMDIVEKLANIFGRTWFLNLVRAESLTMASRVDAERSRMGKREKRRSLNIFKNYVLFF